MARPVIRRATTRPEPVKKHNNTDYRSIENKIVDVSKLQKPMRIALYGRPGSGKTTLAASFPAPVLIDFKSEQGTDSVADVKGLKVIQADEWDDIEKIYWYLSEADHKFKSVIIDTATQMQELAIKKVLEDSKKNTEDAGGWGTMSKQMWGEVSSLLKVWLMNFRNLDMNVVFVAQERLFNAGDEADTDGQLAPEVGPRLMPSVGSTLNAAVDLIGNSFIRETTKRIRKEGKIEEVRRTEFCLRVGPHSYYTTKVRKPRAVTVPAFLVDPTYDDLVALRTGD